MIPAIPKYEICSKPSPWARAGVRYCRILARYTPEDLEESLKASGLPRRKDGIYNTIMPYVPRGDIVEYRSPKAALDEILQAGRPYWAVGPIARTLKSVGKGDPEAVGVTGSIAGGYYGAHSDIDIVVYSPNYPELVVRKLLETGETDVAIARYSGVFEGSYPIGWRRRVVEGKRVTVTLAPSRPGSHCEPLKNYWRVPTPEKSIYMREAIIPSGQESALLYPPCFRTSDGVWIVSFEYNVSYLAFEGGPFKLMGVADGSGTTIYLAVRSVRTLFKRLG
ncbi:MAG: nucleotidyltransferase domain-containing protein [Aeropyrum sp.]|nr:nucleotidyltransferase domain-containing protein [Aeropyrum sp.]MCE4616321.1 nucleotidyltransferase domain-containing protein [Aeropyrum sp.]